MNLSNNSSIRSKLNSSDKQQSQPNGIHANGNECVAAFSLGNSLINSVNYTNSNQNENISCKRSLSKPSSTANLGDLMNNPMLFKHLNKRVILNVGGIRHEVLWKTLEKLPHTRLGRISLSQRYEEIKSLCSEVKPFENELYFDRHANSFGCILNYYRTGKLHLTEDICIISYQDELAYWGIDECVLEPCCMMKFHQRRETVLEEFRREEEAEREKVHEERFQCLFPIQRKRLWDLMENPQTSRAARVIFVILFFLFWSIKFLFYCLIYFRLLE